MTRRRMSKLPAESPFVKSPEWEGMRAGAHQFQVTGEAGWFTFIAYVAAPNGDEWVDCYGGRGETKRTAVRQLRSFLPDRVKRTRSGRVKTRAAHGANETEES